MRFKDIVVGKARTSLTIVEMDIEVFHQCIRYVEKLEAKLRAAEDVYQNIMCYPIGELRESTISALLTYKGDS